MLFDELVSQIFDEIADWISRMEKEVPFIEDILKDYKTKTILDVGCSTGNHAIALGRRGYHVDGIDYSTYAIKTARKNLSQAYLPESVSVRFYQDDFSVFSDLSDDKYDAILVLGNTLSLASNKESVVEVLQNIHRLLEDDGVLIIEVMNFGNNDENTSFVELKELDWEGDACIVQRGYFIYMGSGTYLFNVLRNKDGKWDYWIKESSKIYPFTKSRLEKAIGKAGFKISNIYANFDGDKFKEDAPSLIAILEKE